jgi:ankyrin repeat protein
MVESGAWTPQAYHEYQRMAAGTGNVDSARLMMDYGVGMTIADIVYNSQSGSKKRSKNGGISTRKDSANALIVDDMTTKGKLHAAAFNCDVQLFDSVLHVERSEDGHVNLVKSEDGRGYHDGVGYTADDVPDSEARSLGADHDAEESEYGLRSAIVDATHDDGTTLLMTAAYSGCIPILETLLYALIEDAETLDSLRNEASGRPYADHVRSKGRHFAEGVGGFDVDGTAAHGATALMVAASRGHSDAVWLLAAHGAHVNTKHRFASTTPLHMASELSHYGAVEALCKLGGEGGAVTSTGSTPLHTAAHSGASYETINALV